jgi:hypothetical protein
MAFVVVLVVAIAVVVLVLRAAEKGGPGGSPTPNRPRPQRAVRPVAPDDDPEFLRELERRTRRDDGSPA